MTTMASADPRPAITPCRTRSERELPPSSGQSGGSTLMKAGGVIDAPEAPGGCFVHFSSIQMDGYRQLSAGQDVQFTFERPGFLQDGCLYRALAVWPQE